MFPRGGIGRVKNLPIDTTGRFVPFDALSCFLRLKAAGAVRIFTSEADFGVGTNFYEVAADEVVELPLEDRGIWLKAASGGPHIVQMIVFHRKG